MDQRERPPIRTLRVAAFDDVEDQFWPVNLLIVVLAGFVAGLILATSRFDDPRILHNAIFRLGTVVLTLAAWFAGVHYLRGRMRQRMKLAVLFSLLVHMWLALGLGVGYYSLALLDEEDPPQVEEVVVLPASEVPEERFQTGEIPRRYTAPVETETPRAPVPDEVKRDLDRPTPPAKETVEVPQARPEQIDPRSMRRRELEAARRARRPAGEQVSRQEWKQRPEPDRQAPVPRIQPAQPRREPAPKVERPTRRRTEAPRGQRRVTQQPRATDPGEVRKPARRASEAEPQPDRVSAPKLPERKTRPTDVPQVEVQTAEPIKATEPARQPRIRPREFAVPKERESPVATKQSQEPEAQAVKAPMRSLHARPDMEQRPEIAPTQDSGPLRSPRRDDLGAEAAEPQAGVGAAGERRARLAPSSRARQDRRQPVADPIPTRPPDAEVPAAVPGAGIAAAQPRRIERPSTPEVRVQAGPPDRIARRSSVGPVLDPGRIDQLRLEQPNRQADASSRWDAAASQQEYRTAGLPGERRSEADSGSLEPVTGAGSPLDAAAARRAVASLQGHAGIHLPASPHSTVPRARPGPRLPSGAEPMEHASLAGASGQAADSGGTARRLDGGSSTLVQRAAPGAPAGRAGAVPGVADVTDSLGPVGLAAGRAPASGAEVPALASAEAPRIGRSDRGAAAVAGLGGRAAEDVSGASAGAPPADQGTPRSGPQGTTDVVRKSGGGLPDTRTGRVATIRDGIPGAGHVAVGDLTRAGGAGDTAPGDLPQGGRAGAIRRLGRSPSSSLPGDVPEVVGAGPTEGGRRTAGPSELPAADATGLQHPAGDLPGELLSRGSIEGAEQGGPSASTPGSTAGPRRSAQGDDRGPSLDVEMAGGPLGRSNLAGLPSGMVEADIPDLGPGSSRSEAGQTSLAGGPGIGDLGRQGSGLPVRIAAMPGAGGLSLEPSLDVGLPSRRARPESEVVHASAGRFLTRRSSGRLALDGRAAELPAEAFRQRDPMRRNEQALQRGGSRQSERAVEMGLEFLARTQRADGRWSIHAFPERFEAFAGETAAADDGQALVEAARALLRTGAGDAAQRAALEKLAAKHETGGGLTADERRELAETARAAAIVPGTMQADAAATGLALLSFLGAGYTHRDGKHRETVHEGLQWLLANQKPSGDLFGHAGGSKYTWLYSHGIAAIAMCEAYGMTRDARLKESAERAVAFIAASQDPARGGWRYVPGRESDTSVSGWQLMALKSAQMAGLDVPEETLHGVSAWLDRAQGSGDAARYAYNPFAEDTREQRRGREPSLAMTAEALLMRLYQGWDRDHDAVERGTQYLAGNLPSLGTLESPARDAYYWYYATQVMYQCQGEPWEAWNDRLRPLLTSSQVQKGPLAGSWHPDRPVPDRWGGEGGRLYVTTLNLLMLEVYYRHLPLYKTLREAE